MEKIVMYVRRLGARRLIGSFAGNFLIAVGVSIFKYTTLGNDPSSAMVMAVADRAGLPFSLCLYAFNAAWFLAEIIWGRSYIGVGTFVNWFLIGPVAGGLIALYGRLLAVPASLPARIGVMLIGVVIVCLGVSLYQTSDSGVSAYDSISLCMRDRLPIPYFWCRMLTDGLSALLAWMLGGVVGLGTLTCALGLGPVIGFFDRTVSQKLMRLPPKDA